MSGKTVAQEVKHFCTLSDRNYLFRALALYQSCVEHCQGGFSFWLLCLDEETKTLLEKMRLDRVALLTIDELGDTELADLRDKRSMAEFAWTSKPSLLLHVMNRLKEGEGLTYLDSDMLLYASPAALYGRLTGISIALTPHRYSPPSPSRQRLFGTYNAGWIFIRRGEAGLACLQRWREECLAWCFNRCEDGKFGDQVYLDNWSRDHPGGVAEVSDDAVNIGPWNLRGHRVRKEGRTILIDEAPLLWYHFHGLKFYFGRSGTLRFYPNSMRNDLIYAPYLAALRRATLRIRAVDDRFTFKTNRRPSALGLLKQRLMKLLS